MASPAAAKQRDFSDICAKNDFVLTDLRDEWVDYAEFLSYLPTLRSKNYDAALGTTAVQEMRDSHSHYYFQIADVRREGEALPLERLRPTIRRILFNRRQGRSSAATRRSSTRARRPTARCASSSRPTGRSLRRNSNDNEHRPIGYMMKKIAPFAALALLFAGLFAQAQKRQVMLDKVVAVVGGSAILHSEVESMPRQLTERRRQEGYTSDRDPMNEGARGADDPEAALQSGADRLGRGQRTGDRFARRGSGHAMIEEEGRFRSSKPSSTWRSSTSARRCASATWSRPMRRRCAARSRARSR